MGVLDVAKLARKAQQTRSTMKKVTAAGVSKSGQVAILLNGLNDIVEIQFADELFEGLTSSKLESEIIQAFGDAKKQLEKELASTMDIDSLKEMMSA